jgi:hypothetical protein
MTAIGGIDHLVIVVTDLDHAEATYKKLGFTLSPRANHSEQMGTSNHTIMLQNDYFELLGIRTPTDSNKRWQDALAHGEGLAGMAAQTSNAAEAQKLWRGRGYAASDVQAFSRVVNRPGGVTVDAKFEMTSLPNGILPGASIFACAQLTRNAVWLPELMEHANTAVAIRKFTIVTGHPEMDASKWSTALPGSSRKSIMGGAQVQVAQNAIDFVDPAIARKQFGFSGGDRARAIAIEYAVKDVAACRAALAAGGVSATQDGDRTSVAAPDACGVVLTFAPVGAAIQ